ncbi:MAG: calcium-translocating P-type ATPase, PMCA-type [Clostridia bacterium]|nr:calcium-translocating P-type ATPase, PMCA-type [Clostridia bacterium]
MFFTKKADEAIKSFNSDVQKGLDSKRAEESRQKYGANTFTKAKPVSMWRKLIASLTEPMTLMLVFAAVLTTGINIAKLAAGKETDFIECAGIFAAIILSTAITLVMEGKSAKAFEALEKMNSGGKIRALRDGSHTMLSPDEVVAGDIIFVNAGDRIPADARIITCSSLMVDEAPLTGESMPVEKRADVILPEKTPLAERINMLYSGCYVTGGSACAVIVAVGDKSEFGNIAASLAGASGGAVPIQDKLAALGKLIAKLGAAAAAVVFAAELVRMLAAGGISAEAVSRALISSIILLVAAVPEGLPTIAAVSLALNVIKMSKENALVKKMTACETIGSINVICTDKTGTLTENKMTVSVLRELSDSKLITKNICINSTAGKDESGGFVGNPTECALLSYVSGSGTDTETVQKNTQTVRTEPFSSEKKYMETVISESDGYLSLIKGSPEKIISMCRMTDEERKAAENGILECQNDAGRVIAFGHKRISAPEENSSDGFTFDGFASISDPLRPEVKEAVASCLGAGIDVKILTGDSINTARSIGRALGIITDGAGAYEARQIEEMSDEQLRRRLPDIKIIARSTPETKLRFVNMLKEQKNIVAVTGDGINDAPAIKSANVGIAMGITGTEVSKEAADVVLLDDSFTTIAKAVRMGREIFESFRKFIKFQLTVNLSSVLVVLISVIAGFDAPFTALQLLWINIIMDGPPALTLGLLPVRGNLMKRKPLDKAEGILTHGMKKSIGIKGMFIAAVILAQLFFNFLGAAEAQGSTALFTLFVMFHLMNALNCGGNKLVCRENKSLYVSVGLTFLLQILIVTFLGAMFSTVPLDLVLWLKIICTSALILVIGIPDRRGE